jgi:hypothetical protein
LKKIGPLDVTLIRRLITAKRGNTSGRAAPAKSTSKTLLVFVTTNR